ncbi:glycosyltransferase [Amnibacterium endophyticum]|uniref:D-inositol 3-phosphate glycosyltransferase n=1 Tax=Amnibacterium endophyticum TaxID=2109337 RepID=A0ABW4LA46_9MICO
MSITRDPAHRGSAPLILHVTEAMGGGLEDAVNDFVRSAPGYRHALLYTRRGAFGTAEQRPGLVEVIDAGRGVRSLRRVYGSTVRRLAPDVIHLHSAWAGLIGRLQTRGPRSAPIVYSPHSYFFDRRDLSAPARLTARLLERVLSARTDLTAAVSPFEAETARRLGSGAEYIPNIARLPRDLRWAGGTGAKEVVLVGRVTAQKDPAFLLAMLPHLDADVRLTWVGAGDAATEDRLRAAGVRVTGWVPRSECLTLMASADAYLHTAAWEGSPITLLEAAVLGVPVVARAIPALDSLGFDPRLRTPRAVALALTELLAGGVAPVAPSAPSPQEQADAIGRAYARVLRGPLRSEQPVPVPVPVSVEPTATRSSVRRPEEGVPAGRSRS